MARAWPTKKNGHRGLLLSARFYLDAGAGLETAQGRSTVGEGQTLSGSSVREQTGIPDGPDEPSRTNVHSQRETVSSVSKLVEEALNALDIDDVTAARAALTAARRLGAEFLKLPERQDA